MHKSAVGYAIGKFLQVMGVILIVPMIIAGYDNSHLSFSDMFINYEVYGFILAILFSLFAGTFLVVIFKDGRELQGIKEGYAIVTFGWLSMSG